ncbi:ParH-like protein [Nonomuraea jiangxiensis]|uniref:ParH-like protein n=1 Tax=Nonomuraea jiangxiensis TaxID=633440 RepID=UPI00115FF645|nr:ParH-like protein [Nonomuraea jiangxiensis]
MPEPFDLDEFVSRVAAYRGRPIHLLSVPGLQPSRCLCAETDRGDVILLSESIGPLHYLAVVCHEIAHLLAGHPSDDELIDLLTNTHTESLPDLMGQDTRIHGLLARRHFDSVQEQEAEIGSTMIVSRALYQDMVPPSWGDVLVEGPRLYRAGRPRWKFR